MKADDLKSGDENPHLKSMINLVSFVVVLIVGLSIGTQYIAYNIVAPDAPMFLGIQNPFNGLIWYFKYRAEGYESIYQKGFNFSALFFLIGYAGIAIVNYIEKHKYKKSNVHGSSEWASYDDLKKAGLIDNDEGIYIGGFLNKKTKCIEYLRDNSNSVTIICAPPQSGKTAGIVIPNLLSWPQSAFVYDIKGELWRSTARFRKEQLGQIVLKFDPSSDDGSSCQINPLLQVRIGKKEVKDVQDIVNILSDPDGLREDAHWKAAAESFLVGAILHTLYARKDKSLPGLMYMLSDPERDIEGVLNAMLNTIHDPNHVFGWKNPNTGEPIYTHSTISSVAREMLNKSEGERSSVISTAMRFLKLYHDPIVANNVRGNSFLISDLMNNDKPVSLYLSISPSDKSRVRPLLRLIINQMFTRFLENAESQDERNLSNYKHKLLLMLDEFPSLGKMDELKASLAYVSGYGIKPIIVTQDIKQIYEIYGNQTSFLGLCKNKIGYAANDETTARMISKWTGVSTVRKESKSFSGNNFDNVSKGMTEVSRYLLTEDEVMRLDKDDLIISIENMKPIYGKKTFYYNDPVFKNRVSKIALEKSDSIETNSDIYHLTEKVKEAEGQGDQDGEPIISLSEETKDDEVFDDENNENNENDKDNTYGVF